MALTQVVEIPATAGAMTTWVQNNPLVVPIFIVPLPETILIIY